MPDPPFMARCTRYNIMPWDKFCQWLVTCQWFSPGTPVSSTNKTDHHDITEILLKVALNTINHVCQIWYFFCFKYFTGFLVFKEYCEQLCDEHVSSTPRHEWRIWHTGICIQSNLFKQNPLWTNIFVFGKHRCSDYTDYFTKISYIGILFTGFRFIQGSV
jgi:hypothetical protein